ncbi:MAG: alkaline phosphatase family protein [Thermodesulfobacteriota bacterium]
MGRRTFLKGAGYGAALLAGQTVGNPVKKAKAACLARPRGTGMYSTGPAPEIDAAGFDFYTHHKSKLVAAVADPEMRRAVFDVSVNPISPSREPLTFSVVPETPMDGWSLDLSTASLVLGKEGKTIQCRVTAPAEIPEQKTIRFKVIGRRGAETQEIKLKVTVLTAMPKLEPGLSDTGVREQLVKVTAGEPVAFRLSLANSGHAEDRFDLHVKGPAGWRIRILDSRGREIRHLDVQPMGGMFQWEYPEEFRLEIIPPQGAPRKRMEAFTVQALARATGMTDFLTVRVFHSESLFSIHDLDGFDPHSHYLRPGAMTSYILHVTNPSDKPEPFRFTVTALPAGWKTNFNQQTITVGGGGHDTLMLRLESPHTAKAGDCCIIEVVAENASGERAGRVRLRAEVYLIPKIYFLVIDSLDYAYLELNRDGEGPGKEGDWLCPAIRRFMKKGTSFSNARCGMPAATDMNHTTIMSGAVTGTLGAYWVSGYYAGLDDVGDIRIVRPSPEVLRHGKDGKKLKRIFDLVKERYPEARSAVISNKPWVSHLHEDGEAVALGVTGSRFPVYGSPPPPYVLGDPPTDDDSSDRRPIKPPDLIVNGNPIELLPQVLSGDFHLLRAVIQDIGEYLGAKPGAFPDDRWIADTARAMIREEDPEVLYVNLAATDEAGHVFGAAWDPEEWRRSKGLLYGEHWVSRYSEQARRGEILDVVREADRRFGDIVQEIEDRGMTEHSLIVFAADHSMITEGYCQQGFAPLDIKEYLRSRGIISPRHYGTAWALNHWAAIFDVRDDATRQVIADQLRSMAVDDPLSGNGFHPCIVLDEEGLRSGKDRTNPFIPEAEQRITEPDELYSEYYKMVASDGIRWPEIAVFFRGHYQATTPGDAMIRGVNGMGERVPVLAKSGNRLVGIHGSAMTTHVPMVFSGPGVIAGKEIPDPARLHDILPTLCHLLGFEIPETAAGVIRREILTAGR